MPEPRVPAAWLLTPLLAFGGTLAGTAALFFAQVEFAPAVAGGYGAPCGAPDCVLGIGVLLIAGGFLALCASMIAGTVLGMVHRRDTDTRAAARRGAFVCLWSLLGYLVASALVWIAV
ncbi:hypothetical protein DFQ14_10361 [Halopolyspora algeriensis]|uniref:Uncharacterized protein n=1 Tax=Halopolyspora algeriensis TaxID=1500506 RepID=A0A368VWI5_9ACTN|nr:hypothetical protein [Halopolyspora algeriensis]RCW45098.1 hypothetical protein DFQ14_10361 [Halopolyspora algeriensis]TQM53180.1 hypothetical protein FHU43_2563 [Halopolyspora algeriensis]